MLAITVDGILFYIFSPKNSASGIVFTHLVVKHVMSVPDYILNQVQAELDRLDQDPVLIDGKKLKPSQCYHFEADPTHVLFNTNCPDELRQKVQAILSKYIPDENRTR